MKKHILVILLFFTYVVVSYAQLKIFPLTFDPQRRIVEVDKTNLKRLKTNASPDSVKPGVTIRLIKGNNPRCKGTPETLRFMAHAINGGPNPVLEWLVDGNLILSDSIQYTSSSLSNGQKIECRLISSLDCASPKVVLSDSFKIIESDTLMPSITIFSINGDKDACEVITPVTFMGIVLNGGDNPTISWFNNNVSIVGASSLIWAKDSMADKGTVQATLKSNLGCTSSDTSVKSNVIRRNIYKNLINKVSVKLDSITNPDCGQRKFNFSALPVFGGPNPLYLWYVNGVKKDSSYTGSFSTPLSENGDEVKVIMSSALFCASPKNIESVDYFQRTDTIQLPLFDDFTTSSTPSKTFWIKNGGTYINNTYALNPPTYNTATFDGLRYNGLVYDSVLTSTKGVTDNLTSLPINLSGFTNENNIYLSFYWQPQGLGEAPDFAQGDKLTLYFKNANGGWIMVWQQLGDSVHPFKQAIIPINNDSSNSYLHSGFQFKFESTGRLSGTFDIWNIDYIYLNKNRYASDTFFLDQSFSQQPGSLLKKYSSMPFKQFFGNENKELKDSIFTSLNNLSNVFNNITYSAKLVVNNDAVTIPLLNETTARLNGETKNSKLKGTIQDSLFLNLPNERMEIKSIFQLSGDADNSTVDNKRIPYTVNNTISGLTIFDNFYAYDDGSAEYGIGINQNSALVGYRFTINKPDTLTQIGFYFTRLGGVLIDQTINIFITKRRPTRIELNSLTPPDNVLYNENKLIKYSDVLNNFTLYKLETPIVVTDTFYVGYKQFSDQKLAIGWDLNTDASENMFYNLSEKWEPYTESKGSMMIRPIFGEYRYLLENKPLEKNDGPVIYPNPSDGNFYVRGKFDSLTLYDLQGTERFYSGFGEKFNVDFLNEGVYIIKLVSGRFSRYSKILIQR